MEGELEETAKREQALKAAVWRAVNTATTNTCSTRDGHAPEEFFEYVVALLFEEFEQVGGGETKSVALSTEKIEELVGDLLTSTEELEEDEPGAFYEALASELKLAQDELVDDELSEGQCELCEREMPLTRHHVIPRAVHKEYRKKGFSMETLSSTINICRPCHSAIHKFIPVKDMAAEYNTVEKLLEVESVRKFIEWNSKQKIRLRLSKTNKYQAQ
eukprot:Plantae.Rhodophyta-Purpureofilum_apyrenoidigerum.ctg12885.p1 GENE.Plantae.Rhodophyta-Purpureofilum_apyrenoidigerum.ctg12885~~Plantae.Rhodophyta-Purpureofilum_apyrenoidigerum.ctg12885.p1  ORF type:complete len:217 (-),score=53.06 Plantae.Rhodophyta-Purpureofilum_apyrenoidigerum.ctg12885:640-1290(-)